MGLQCARASGERESVCKKEPTWLLQATTAPATRLLQRLGRPGAEMPGAGPGGASSIAQRDVIPAVSPPVDLQAPL
ncbi:UNVERIFIED_CONTAM: hypothetical protein K2H54_036232 [Gekko kuhli]